MFTSSRMFKPTLTLIALCAITVAGYSSPWTSIFKAAERIGFLADSTSTFPAEQRHASMLAPLSGTYNIPGDYPSLDAAITDLNVQGVGGSVTLNLLASNPQTAPAGGYLIGGSGSSLLTTTSASNTVTIQGNGNTVTASAALTIGALNDAIFKVVGADWITISGFNMQENVGNTVTTAASNNMTEFGVALFYVTATDNANNITISGNTIDLNRTYQNTFGIYANATHTATAVTTTSSGTGSAGGNSGLVITANNITDVNDGIVIVGPTAAADNNDGITVGGSVANANTITNFGTTGTFSSYANVSGTVNGILVRNSKNFSVSFNSITSSAGGVTVGTLNGIQIPAQSNAATGTFTDNINNNSFALQSGIITGAINGINVPSGSASVTSTININNNNFTQLNYSAAASGTVTAITNSGGSTAGPLVTNINNNTFANLSVNSTGSFTFISDSFTAPTNATKNVNGNSILTGFNKTGAGGTVTLFTDNGSDTAGTANNVNGNNFSNITVSGATTLTGISDTNGGAPTKSVNNNTIVNITGGTSSITPIAINFDGGTTTATGNTVSNVSCGCAITGISVGTSGAGTTNISQNTVHSLIGTGTGAVTGISVGGTTGTIRNVFRNKIYNLENSNAAGSTVGLTLASGTALNTFNNLIGDLRATAVSAVNSLIGINVTSTTTTSNVNVSFNTVYLNGASTGANFGSSALFATTSATATTANLVLKDNILVNTSAAAGTGLTAAYRRSSSALNNFDSASNNNLFYAGSPSATNLIFYDGTNSDLTLTSYKARVASRDSASISENPPFLSTVGANANFLHINSSAATQIESGGTTVAGITSDFDNDTRNALTPDVGADEFTGVPLDLNPPSISYTTLNNTSLTTNRTLPATITDPSGVASGGSSPRIYFRKNGGSYASTQCTGTYNCVIDYSMVGGVAIGDIINYFVIAQDTGGNVGSNPSGGLVASNVNTVTTPPTTPNSYSVIAAVSSSVNVGTGETYTSLTNNDSAGLFQAINSGVLASNVTINLTSDLAGETGTVALNEWAEDGAGGYSLTIKPSGGARMISGSSTNSIIRLNGADRVTIDGSQTGGTAAGVGGDATLRNLTIQNTNTAATAGAVIAVMQGANSANNVTIKNVIISGQDPTQTLIGIHVGGNTVGASPTTASNNNVQIDNCAFKRSFIAIFDNGVSSAAAATGNVISHNDITATGADRMRRAGIFFFNQNGIQVSENAIGGITADESADAIGIIAGVQNVTTTATTSGGVYNAVIAKNRISGISSTNTTGFSAVGIAIAGDPAGDNFIGNNMVSGVSSPATSPDIVAGIFVSGVAASNTHLFLNSVAMTGDRGSVASQIGSYGVAISGANPTVELKDNIFYTTQTSGGGANAKSYSIGIGTSAFTNLSSNFNDFISTGANAGGFRTGSLDTTGTDLATMAAWQSATSGDANSFALDPQFINPASDPHIAGTSPMINAGTVIAAIHDDIDSQMRDAQPDIGADEVQPGTIQFSSATYSVAENGGSATLTVTRMGGTDGAVSINYTTGGGSATGGAACGGSVDYVNTAGTINFANGDGANKTITVPICNDSTFEGNETFVTTLNTPTGGAVIGMNATSTTTITDDKTIPSIQFSSDTYSTVEAVRNLSPEGVPGTQITITLSGPSQSNASVNYATSGGTATGGMACTAGVDYVSASGTATINAGQTSTSFFVPICQDSVFEGDETVNLLLSGPSGATLGTPSFAQLTITDNDAASPVEVTATAGTPGPTGYMTLKDAVDAINAGTHQGNIIVEITTSTVEGSAPIVLNGIGAGSASYSSILIRPTADAITVSGSTPAGRGLIELNGADNVSIDGDNPNSAGINRNLTLQNTAVNTTAFTSVIRIALSTLVSSADNDVVQNCIISGSATGRNISSATSQSGSEFTTYGILVGGGASTASNTTAPSAITSVTTTIGAGVTAVNFTANNNQIDAVARGIAVQGSATTVADHLTITNNTIGNANVGNATTVYARGVTAQGFNNASIAGNTVRNIEGWFNTQLMGISVGDVSATGQNTLIDRNNVSGVINHNTGTFGAYGINLAAGNAITVQNNFVSGINGDMTGGVAFSTTFGVFGIRSSSGVNHKFYHNSVDMFGTRPGTATSSLLGAAFAITSTTQTGLDVRNNIFVNALTGGTTGVAYVAVFLPSGATSSMNLTMNNNNYFGGISPDATQGAGQAGTTAGTNFFTYPNFDSTQTTPSTNLRSYTSTLSSAGTNDSASQKVDPQFVSSTDLHIAPGSPMVNAGANVGVAYDIDGQTRVAVPDIGADEPGGTTPPANDIAAAVIINPANSSTQPTGASTSPQASFTNTGSATQTNVGVKFTISGPGGYSYLGTQTIATISPFQTVVVTFPVAPTFNLAGAYTTNAQVTTADSNATNDAISGTFQVISPVSGTVNVGNGGDFTSLSNPGGLFDLINTVGVSGNVTALITSDLTSETGAIPLNSMAAGSSLTIKPSGAARTVSGSGASLSMIKLNGADNVIIDGSLSGSTDRSLTLMYTNTAGAVIWIGSASTGNGANGDMIKNCMIASNPGTLSIAGIVAGSGTTLGGNAEAPNNNNWIINNQIFRVQNSAFIAGAAALDQGWLVADNNFGSNVQADKNVFRGMLIGNTQNMSVIHNTISGISSTTTTAAAMSGIQLAFSLNGGIVVENRISDIKNNSASGTGAFGMQISATSAASNVLIANNFISDVAALGSATVVNNGHGINVNGAGVGGLRIYHNSVNMNTNQASGTTSALNVTSAVTTAGAIDLRNNILTNSQTSGATRFAVFNASSASVISPINGNDYFAQNVGSIAGVTKATLADWLATTGQDSNSVAVDPLFISSTDLHLQTGSPMRNAGVTGLGITTDIDGQTRDANPDIGADELPPLVLSGTLQLSSATYSISEGGGMVTITVTRTGGSSGAVGVNFATSNGTATGGGTCGGSVDYVNTSGSLMWADGDMASKTFTIPVCNDVIPEPDETVNIALSGATGGATVGTPATSVLTITNDDIPGTLSVNDVRVWEGNGGNVNATFTVSYIGNAIPVSVQYSTSNGTATAGVDYISSSGTLNFNAPAPSPELGGSVGQTQTVTVAVVGDTNKEENETFFLNLSNPVNAVIGDGQGVGIINDEDRTFVSDFDRDQTADISVYRPNEGRWYVLQTTNATPKVVPFGNSTDRPVPGDYDGDGFVDYAVFRESTGTWFIKLSSNDSEISVNWGSPGDKPVQGDYDGDGKTDIAIYRPSTGYWWFILSSDGSRPAVQFGLSSDLPTQADYDGDGKTDIAVYRNGTWYIARSRDSQVQVTNFGISTDKPVTGDFDGDGSYDVAIYRDGDWWIVNSLTGTVRSLHWGLATDIPVPADYDKDGITDIAVFRPSNGDWYVLKSTTNSLVELHWGTNGDVPIPSAYLPQ